MQLQPQSKKNIKNINKKNKMLQKDLKTKSLETINTRKPQKEPDTPASTTTPVPPSSSSTSTGSSRPTTTPPRSPPSMSPLPGEMPRTTIFLMPKKKTTEEVIK